MRAKTNIVWFLSVYFLVLFSSAKIEPIFIVGLSWYFMAEIKGRIVFICLINDVFISMRVQNHKRLSFDFESGGIFTKSFQFIQIDTKKIITNIHWNVCVEKVFLLSNLDFSSRQYRGIITAAKNQLSWLFGTHSPWLILLSFILWALAAFIVEVELKSDIPI